MSGWNLGFVILLSFNAWAVPPCPAPLATEHIVTRSLFGLYHERVEVQRDFDSLYESGRRLRERAYWDPIQNRYVLPFQGGLVLADPRFIQSVIRHAEVMHERRYVDFLFYPDMGHSHFFIPDADWPELEKIQSPVARMQAMVAAQSLKILYHTAELVLLKGDDPLHGPLPTEPWKAWRYHSRNVLGDNEGGENLAVLYAEGQIYNTVRQIPGYVQRTGFYISASREGCFEYRTAGGIRRFDLTLGSLPSR